MESESSSNIEDKNQPKTASTTTTDESSKSKAAGEADAVKENVNEITSSSITESTVVLTTSQILGDDSSSREEPNSGGGGGGGAISNNPNDLTKSYAIHESMLSNADSDNNEKEEKIIVKEVNSENNNDTSATNESNDEEDEEDEDEDEKKGKDENAGGDQDQEASNEDDDDEGSSFPPNTFTNDGLDDDRKPEPASPPSSPVNEEHTILQKHAIATSVINAAVDDLENIVKDYEIPNIESSETFKPDYDVEARMTTSSSMPTTSGGVDVPVLEDAKKASDPKPPKNLAEEKFERILGNDSLMKKIVAYGDESSGQRPLTGQMCTIAYKAYIKDTDKLVEHDDDLNFILGDGDVVTGLDMSVSLMYKNEKSEIICDSRHAYGPYGKLPTIPANTSLKYEVHLKEHVELPEFDKMDAVQRLSLAEAKKLRGNFNYNRQDFEMAILSYKRGLKYFEEENLDPAEDQKNLEKFVELRSTLLMNTALSYFKLSDFKMASETLDELLKAQSKHKKALYIKGKVLLQMGELADAIKFFNKSLELDPANAEVKNELAKAQAKYKVQRENEKKLYQKMLQGVSETSEQAQKKSKSKSTANVATSNYFGYLAAGVVIAVASVGVAMFVKYKNLI